MTWKRVCGAGDVTANTLKKFDVDGVPILIANLGDEFRAYPPLCPHMEEPLEQSGICEGGVLTCSKHLWQWQMLTGEPNDEVTEKPLLLYEVKREGDDVLVNVEQELSYDYDEDQGDDDDDSFWD